MPVFYWKTPGAIIQVHRYLLSLVIDIKFSHKTGNNKIMIHRNLTSHFQHRILCCPQWLERITALSPVVFGNVNYLTYIFKQCILIVLHLPWFIDGVSYLLPLNPSISTPLQSVKVL